MACAYGDDFCDPAVVSKLHNDGTITVDWNDGHTAMRTMPVSQIRKGDVVCDAIAQPPKAEEAEFAGMNVFGSTLVPCYKQPAIEGKGGHCAFGDRLDSMSVCMKPPGGEASPFCLSTDKLMVYIRDEPKGTDPEGMLQVKCESLPLEVLYSHHSDTLLDTEAFQLVASTICTTCFREGGLAPGPRDRCYYLDKGPTSTQTTSSTTTTYTGSTTTSTSTTSSWPEDQTTEAKEESAKKRWAIVTVVGVTLACACAMYQFLRCLRPEQPEEDEEDEEEEEEEEEMEEEPLVTVRTVPETYFAGTWEDSFARSHVVTDSAIYMHDRKVRKIRVLSPESFSVNEGGKIVEAHLSADDKSLDWSDGTVWHRSVEEMMERPPRELSDDAEEEEPLLSDPR